MDWDEVDSLFAQGLHTSDLEREALVASANVEVAARVRELWADADGAGSFLAASLVPPAEPSSHTPGQLIAGRFALLQFLGAGGMGEVFSARDEKLGRLVALKFIRAELAVSEQATARLEREARALCSLAHPHICTLHDVVWEESTPVLVMEYLEGETLAARLARGPMPLRELLPLAIDAIDGLAHAHQSGVVHRDLKPANVMLTRVGGKIFDFGIAKHLPADSVRIATTMTREAMTREGTIVGSASYMSPEQAEGRQVDARSDIFSFGCVLYEMVTGSKAFTGDSDLSTLAAVFGSEPTPIRDIVGGTPTRLVETIAKCLKKEPEQRYQSAAELQRALRGVASAWSLAGPGAEWKPLRAVNEWWTVNRNRAAAVVAALIGTIALSMFALRDYRLPPSSPRTTDSIAVLPFERAANDPDLEYVADGLSESVTNALSRVRALQVVARATAFAYKGRTGNVRDIGRALKVRAVVMGRVSRTGERIRVQAELIDVAAGAQIWGQQYVGSENDLLRIQADLAQAVGQHLGLDQRDTDAEKLQLGSTDNPKAYQLYLRGRHALSRSAVADTQRGIGLFQEALELDPTYALAYTGLADSYIGLSGMYLAPNDAMTKAKAAASRAIDLDPALAEAHVSMGVIHAYYDFDWRRSEEALTRAIELQPNVASARLWYAWNLVNTGRTEEGIAQAHLALELDPLSAFVETGVAQMYYFSKQPLVAIQRLRSVVQSAPDFFNGHHFLGVAYLHVDGFRDAILELEQARRLDPNQPQPIAYLAYAYSRLGDAKTANERFAELTRLGESRYVSAYLSAVSSVGFGRDDEAVQWLQKAYDDRDDMLSILGVDSPFVRLRSDARVRTLLAQIGLG